MSSSSPPSPNQPGSSPSFHFHPHSVHLSSAAPLSQSSSGSSSSSLPPAPSSGLLPPNDPTRQLDMELDEDDHDYESLGVQGFGVNMLAGALAGISEHAAIFPVDSIKTRMQVLPSLTAIPSSLSSTFSASSTSSGSSASSTPLRNASSLAAHPPAPPPIANTIRHQLRAVSTTDGLRSLWRGVASVIIGAGPAHAVHYGCYEFVRDAAGGRREGWAGVAGTAAAGAAAVVSSDALMNPFDVIKQRMQLSNSPFRSVASCARHVYRHEGLTAFYVSYPTTLTMSVPFTAVQFSVYESLKSLINPEGTYSPITHVTAGGIAGGVAAAVTTPLDVAKTLLQTRGSSSDARIRKARGMWEALGIIKERDGWKGLRRGLVPRVLTVAPSTALSWLSYEFFKVLIRQGGVMPETGQKANVR